MKKNYTCYKITMPGFAGVPACNDPSFILFEKLIVDFIHENKIDKPILVGHSLGGSLSMALAGDFPKLFSKIVVVDTLPFLLVLNTPLEAPDTLNCDKEVAEVLDITDEQFYRMQKQAAWRFTVDTLNQKNIIHWAVQSDRKTFAKLYCDLTNTDLRKRISGIECPSLILLQPNFSDRQQAVTDQFQNLAEKKIEYASRDYILLCMMIINGL
ncbi:MAG TPA: alpha/beta hydrolase [Bacteroidia bacterium]|nr:alpha/beta hydrolase [Bacteroidia bacterium]